MRSIGEIASYHSHIYYDAGSKPIAAELRQAIADRFPVQMGRWHEVPVGPPPRAMYQVAFDTALFPSFVPWLLLNRGGLAILVHPNTDSPHDDHLLHALW